MKEDWIEQLRRKLENYEVEPPPGLWEDICKQMGLEPEPASKKAAISRWWWAAAAAVLALVGFFVFYSPRSEQPMQANAVSQKQEPEQPSSEQPSSKQPSSEQLLAQLSSSQQSPKAIILRHHINNPVIPEPAEEQEPITSEENPSYTEPSEASQQEKPAKTQEQSQENKSKNQDDRSLIQTVPQYQTSQDSPKTSASPNQWSVGLMASGGLLAANNSQRTYYSQNYNYSMSDTDKSSYNSLWGYYNLSDTNASYWGNIGTYTLPEYIVKHHIPLRLGLSLQYQLNPRLALLSGISYTRLSSEFSLSLYQNISYSQRLHYVGIPLGVTWQLWKASHFRFYLSGGAMVEKCVSVDVDGTYSGKKPWQWSVNAAAGAEYAFMPSLGAYLEPSLGYYFSDGTQLDHYYKEHPLAPSIEFGLRMHLGR